MSEHMGLNPNFSLQDLMESSSSSQLTTEVAEESRLKTKSEGRKEAEEEYKLTIEELQRENITDSLTKLLNRRGWIEVINHFDPGRGDTGTIVIFDVNGLKETNDNFGHPQGDILIKNSADFIKKVFKRSQDQIFSFQSNDQVDSSRTGGDEFAVFVKGIKTIEDKQKLEEFIEDSFSLENQKNVGISLAYGIAHFNPEIDTQGLDVIDRKSGEVYETTFDRADRAMYQKKAEQKAQQNLPSQASVNE